MSPEYDRPRYLNGKRREIALAAAIKVSCEGTPAASVKEQAQVYLDFLEGKDDKAAS